MNDDNKTKEQLIDELTELRHRINELEAADIYRQLAEAALVLSEERFSKAFQCNPDPITITSLGEGRYVEVNDAFLETTGYERHEVIGRTVFDLDIWINPQERDLMVQELREHGYIRRSDEIKFRTKYGQIKPFLFSTEIIDMDGSPHLLFVTKDITELKKAQEEIKYLSFHDKLTGLYNRAYFEEELKRIDTERQLPISLIMGDVNGLKLINDALGHHEGDKLLIAVADVLKKSCRQEDIAARWGGDEFIILLPRCDSISAVRALERVKSSCRYINDLPIQTIISLGLASKYSSDQDMMDVIKEAEEKMYRNKLLESRSIRSSFLSSLENTLWTRSHESKEHCQRLEGMARKIGQAINLPDSELDNLRLLAALHDIGKIAISNNILDKPQKLTPEECEYVKKHSEVGYRIAISSPEMAPVAQAILHHHEHWDGSGYPMGMKGEEIPVISRIIAIVDAQDVIVTGRPYQKAFSAEEAWSEIQRCAGTQFDPELVRIATEVFGIVY